jgi:xanthine dehydrogenase molybdenum-binding subunit
MAATGLRVVGRRLPMVDAADKVRGRARYADDLTLPGMLFARLVRCDEAHAALVTVDHGSVEDLPGVVAVLSAANVTTLLPQAGTFDPACHDAEREPPFSPVPGDARLFDRVCRYAGEPLAMVVAASDAAALEAAGALEYGTRRLQAVLDPDAALAEGAPVVHDGAPGNVAARVATVRGDVDAALRASTTLECRLATSKQKQAQLEPTCCVARPEPDGGVTVWSPTQCPHRARRTLAHLFGLPLTKVRVVNTVVGGAFGKGDALAAEHYAVAAALVTERPVKLRLSRVEDFVGTESRHPARASVAAGFSADGAVAALRARVVLDGGAYLSHSPRIAGVLLRQLTEVYAVPNVDVDVTVAFTNTPVSGAFRGYGGPQAAFVLEHVVDLGARAVGVDPLEARVRMLRRVEELEAGSRRSLLECIERGRRAVSWDERRARPAGTGTLRRGVGMACVVWKSGIADKPGALDRSGAAVQLHEDGSVDVLSAACDLGTGSRTTLAQIVAEVLGLPFDQVRVSVPDTAVTPYDSGAFASRTLYRAGRAAFDAAAQVRDKVLAYAGEVLEVAPADLELADGRVSVRGAAATGIGLGPLLRRAMFADRDLRGLGDAGPTSARPTAAVFAEVEVDLETGVTVARRLVVVQDVGRAINPQIVEGQMEGGAYQGLGYALTEDLVVDDGTGAVLTGSFMDYRMPTAADGPRVETVIVEEPDPNGPFGAKGAGEPSIVLVAPAVANAILHATGASVTTLPMTPERVLGAVRSLQAPPGSSAR